MRYWYTLDSIFSRIIRVTSDLNAAMRVFSYTFILGLATRPTVPIRIGTVQIDENCIQSLAVPIFIFVLIDIAHPLAYLIGLHIIQLCHWKEFKKYSGPELEAYDAKSDKTELVIEPNPVQIFFLNVLPTILLLTKIVVISCMFIILSTKISWV